MFGDDGIVLYLDCDGGYMPFIHVLKFLELYIKKLSFTI